MKDRWDYKVTGKNGGLIRIILFFAVSAFFVILAADQLKGGQKKSIILGTFFCAIALSTLYLFVKLAIRYFFFKVYIGEKGFYFQSNPFNGKYYEYETIRGCNEELRTSKGANTSTAMNAYFFTFIEKDGKAVTFQFEKALYEREFDTLKQRIENAAQKR